MDGFFFDSQFELSLLLILMNCTIAWLMRFTIRNLFPEPTQQARILLCEVCSTIEKVAISHELQIVFAANGMIWYLVLFTLINIWFNSNWEPTKSSSVNNIRGLKEEKTTWVQVVLSTGTEMIIGFLVYPLYVKPLWQLYDQQLYRWAKVNMEWSADLQTSVLVGGLTEFSGGAVSMIVSKSLAEWNPSKIVQATVSSLFNTGIVYPGLFTSGGYYDPMLASIMQYGCKGPTILEHIVVYWICVIVGQICGCIVWTIVEKVVGVKPDRKSD